MPDNSEFGGGHDIFHSTFPPIFIIGISLMGFGITPAVAMGGCRSWKMSQYLRQLATVICSHLRSVIKVSAQFVVAIYVILLLS